MRSRFYAFASAGYFAMCPAGLNIPEGLRFLLLKRNLNLSVGLVSSYCFARSYAKLKYCSEV